MNILEALHDEDGEVDGALDATPSSSIVGTLRAIIEHVLDAKKENDRLQAMFAAGSKEWHACETVDDHLHEALLKLGD